MTGSSSRPFQGKAPGAMPPGARRRYIVRAAADAAALRRFIDTLAGSPAIRLVDTIGPAGGPPHTVVVETDHDTAEQLRQRNQHQLTIEPDQPLSLFD